MKQIVRLGVWIAVIITVASCTPKINNPESPVTLDESYTDLGVGGTKLRSYQLSLSCGCSFAMAVDSVDSSKILFRYTTLAQTITPQYISSQLNGALASGTYTGYLALRMAPPSTDTFHVVLRDTIVVP